MTINNTTTSPPAPQSHFYSGLDLTFAGLYFLCFVVGCPGNITAAVYFLRRQKELPTLLYGLTALTDVTLCSLSIFVGVSFFVGRQPLVFDNSWFCAFWSLTFHGLQYFSIFLIAVLSTTRTYTLFYPLRRVNKRWIICILVGFVAVAGLYRMLPNLLGVTSDVFTEEDVYCWSQGDYKTYPVVNYVLQVISISLLVLPILPVTLSCVISVHLVLAKNTLLGQSASGPSDKLKRGATVTIILITVVYIFCNIPLCINAIIWLYELVRYGNDTGPFYESSVLTTYYIWNFVDVLSVVINSTLNFVIYIVRTRNFRHWIIGGVLRRKEVQRASTRSLPEPGRCGLSRNTSIMSVHTNNSGKCSVISLSTDRHNSCC